jgi:hypothetical protein
VTATSTRISRSTPVIRYGPLRRSGDLAGAGLGDGEVAGQDRDKLIAAPAADIVAGAYLAAQAGGHLLQNLVSIEMSEPIVDFLEAVQIEEQNAEFLPSADARGELAIQVPAVGDAG